jgi:hypothetical protein
MLLAPIATTVPMTITIDPDAPAWVLIWVQREWRACMNSSIKGRMSNPFTLADVCFLRIVV